MSGFCKEYHNKAMTPFKGALSLGTLFLIFARRKLTGVSPYSSKQAKVRKPSLN